MKNLYDSTMQKLKQAIEDVGSIRSLADKLKMNPSTVTRWFAEGRSPEFRGLSVLLEHLGVQIVFPHETAKDPEDLASKELLEKLTLLEQENVFLKADSLRKEGAISLLKEQLAELREEKKYQSNQEIQTSPFTSRKKEKDRPA